MLHSRDIKSAMRPPFIMVDPINSQAHSPLDDKYLRIHRDEIESKLNQIFQHVDVRLIDDL